MMSLKKKYSISLANGNGGEFCCALYMYDFLVRNPLNLTEQEPNLN